jgi:glutathione synthase/RimK-type ligase-like ATP-grasp enzyme
MPDRRPIAIYHEHQDWFRPLFEELDRRGTRYVRIDARRHRYDPASRGGHYSLLFNRMSPSAYKRGNGHGIFYTLSFLEHLERLGVRVVNGSKAFSYEISKALQLSLLESLGQPYPRSRVINHPAEAPAASDGLRYPLLVKPNVGGSGAEVVRFDSRRALEEAVVLDRLDVGIDRTGLVQEFVPARGGFITRIEILGGRYLYAIRVYLSGETFDLCPADICKTRDGVELVRSACPVDAPKTGVSVDATTPPPEVITAAEKIMAAAGIEVGGIEYMIDDRDGGLVFYDINALSNFVADGPRVVGFNPHARLADYLEQEARQAVEPGTPESPRYAAGTRKAVLEVRR